MRYEFKCPDCETTVVLDVPIDERDEPRECAECAGPLRRLFSNPSIQRMVGIGKRRK